MILRFGIPSNLIFQMFDENTDRFKSHDNLEESVDQRNVLIDPIAKFDENSVVIFKIEKNANQREPEIIQNRSLTMKNQDPEKK